MKQVEITVKMRINNPFSRRNLLILFPLILVMLFDLIFTLVGQPEIYWEKYTFVWEGSPLGHSLLSLHPGYFILFFIIYLLFVLFLVTNLKRPLNIMVAIGFFLGHSWGSASWVPEIFVFLPSLGLYSNWYYTIFYFIFLAIISGFCINKWLIKYEKNS